KTYPPRINLTLVDPHINHVAEVQLDVEQGAIIGVLPKIRVVSKQSKRDMVGPQPTNALTVPTPIVEGRKIVLTLSLNTQRHNLRVRGLGVPRPSVGEHGVTKVLNVVIRGPVRLVPEPAERDRTHSGQIKMKYARAHAVGVVL